MTTGNSSDHHARTTLRRGRVPALAAGAALALSAFAPVPAASALAPGSISGVVTDDLGDPLAGIEVTAIDLDLFTGDVVVATAVTNASGAYVLDGIAPDPYYKVGFSDPDGVWATEYFDDSVAPVISPGQAAKWVAVLDGAETDGIDASLEPGAEVSGRVTVGAGGPVRNGRVQLWWRSGAQAFMRVGSYATDQDGNYSIPGVRAESYRLIVTDPATGGQADASFVVDSDVDSTVDVHIGGVVTSSVVPEIVGTPQVGQTLTASSGWTPSDAAVTYRWVVGDDSSPADDPTGATYAPTAQDVGKAIHVVATAAKGAGWVSATATSAATSPVTAAPVPPVPPVAPTPVLANDRAPKVKGKTKVGKTLRVTKGSWTPYPQDVTYTWYASGKVIKSAKRQWFTLTRKQVGKRITVVVTASAPGYDSLIVTTARTAKVTD